jgi:hypothetical protein
LTIKELRKSFDRTRVARSAEDDKAKSLPRVMTPLLARRVLVFAERAEVAVAERNAVGVQPL